MDRDVLKRLLDLERRLDSLAQPERGWTPHFLTTPYTNTDFDGDSFSDVAANTKIENTSWSTTIPADAKALIISGYCRDSGSAGTVGLYFALYTTAGAGTACFVIDPSSKANDDTAYKPPSTVPCINGDLWYRVNASGASTMDVWLLCWGYWI